MKLSPKQNKWVKILLILFFISLIFGGLLYYVVVKKFESIIQLTVSRESDGLYFFDAASVKLNLLKKSIGVRNAVVYCTDTTRRQTYHELKAPNMYLRVNSWVDLILKKKLIIDSLNIDLPSLQTRDYIKSNKEEKSIAAHATSVFDILHMLAANVEIGSLNIQNGAYTYSNNKNKRPFSCNHIYLVIKNFSRKEGQANQLFSADDLDISLYNQHWELTGGIHDISFKRVHFSGKNQFFELDTCTFHKAAEPGKSEIALSADQFYFNSKRLTALQEQEELLIDTLICFRPVLSLIPANSKNIIPDSIGSVSQSIKGLFKHINFKYIDIREGQLALTAINSKDTVNTTKTNLKIYNLTVNPIIDPHITTDSIKLDLNKLLFFTKDSLNQLSVDEFKLYNNDIIFKNAVYGPTPRNNTGKAITFTTASLQLKNINLEELVKKKLKAAQADLYDPTISMIFTGKEKKRKGNFKKTAQFFETLHDISELIDVPDFNIIHGNLNYIMRGSGSLKMEMKNMNAHILLKNFLVSDSLIDIKRSVPMLEVDALTLQTPGTRLLINDYKFVGKNKHNLANKFQVMLANGSSISGKYLYWELLDWDQFVNKQEILVETLLVNELVINSRSGGQHAKKPSKIKFPLLNIHQFDIGDLKFIRTDSNYSLQFTGSAAGFNSITTKNNYLLWQKAHATLNNLVFTNLNSSARVGKINFTNEETVFYESTISNRKDESVTKVMIPELNVKAAINSTNFSLLHLTSLAASRPQIDIFNTRGKVKTDSSSLIKNKFDFIADKFIVKNASINYATVSEHDTFWIHSDASLDISGIQSKKNEVAAISYGIAITELSDFQYKNKSLTVDIPKISSLSTNSTLEKSNKNQLSFNRGLEINWSGAAVKWVKPGSMEMEVIQLDGNFKDAAFSYESNDKLQWQQLLAKTKLNNAKIFYKNNHFTAKTDSIQWDPLSKTFYAQRYSMMPILEEAEAFSKAKWQADYLTLEGEALNISGLQVSELHKDSLLSINKIKIENSTLQATRDRNIPFRHNIEKLMPGALINSLKKMIRVDSILVKNSNILVHEIAIKSGKKTTIPITQLNGDITHLNNVMNDSLTINAQASILNNKVTNFYYQEANRDSLSFFQLKVNAAPMQLVNLNDATIPMANIRIKKGSADTLYAAWAGNKHAAAGTINFHYKHLKIQLLDKNDIEKNRFILSVISNLSSLVFRKNNDKPALIYFSRDKEKFVFNYWVKSIASGILTSAGIRKNKKYIKQYNAVKEKYDLPEMTQ